MVWPLSLVLPATMLSLPHTSEEDEQADPLLTRILGGDGGSVTVPPADGWPPRTIPHSIRIRPAPRLSCFRREATLMVEQSIPDEVVWALARDGWMKLAAS